MKPKVNPQTAWAIVTPVHSILRYSVRRLRSTAISDFVSGSKIVWSFRRKQGYRCIKVNIVPVDEGK